MRTRRSAKLEGQLKPITKTSPSPKAKPAEKNHVPDVLYTEDGTTFYPCKHCCRAFAHRNDLKKHTKLCATVGKGTTTIHLDREEHQPQVSLKSPKIEENNNNNNNVNNEKEPALKQKDDLHAANVRTLTFNTIPDSINAYDLKTKAKIVKHLNETLETSPIRVFVMENGDLVAKIQQTAGGHVEITSRSVDVTKVQITIRVYGRGEDEDDEEEEEVPELSDILEKLFGAGDASNGLFDVAFKEEEVAVADEMEIAEDSELGDHGAIVLEDLDIHICKQCGAVYHTLEDLVTHDKYEHRKFKKKYSQAELEKYALAFRSSNDKVCPICMKKLRTTSSWPRHMQSHSEIGLFACRICKQKFTRDDHRKSHESRHILKEEPDSSE